MKNSHIEWTAHTWNPVTGCREVSPGCDHCYAKVIAENKRGTASFPKGFDVTLRPHKMDQPVRWRKPSLIFVNSMSDLFHKDIPPSYLREIWSTMLYDAPHHIYQILTKRPHRARTAIKHLSLPLADHIWLGVSVENQTFADNRIPELLSIGGKVPWLSCEPLLGPLDLTPWIKELGWIVDGGESGSGRRAAPLDWFRYIRDQCLWAEVPYLHKQGNAHVSGRDRELDGRLWDEYPSIDHPALDAAPIQGADGETLGLGTKSPRAQTSQARLI